MTDQLSITFDYGDLPPADAKALERHANNVAKIAERQRKTSSESVIELGKELAAAQERLSNRKNGVFKKWVQERCGISFMTACRTLASLSAFGCSNNLLPHFEPSAMYLLSADTCPEDALEDAKKAAEAGEVISHKRAKEIIDSYTVEAVTEDEEPERHAGYWELDEAITQCDDAVFTLFSKWPPDAIQVLADKLVSLGMELKEKGELVC